MSVSFKSSDLGEGNKLILFVKVYTLGSLFTLSFASLTSGTLFPIFQERESTQTNGLDQDAWECHKMCSFVYPCKLCVPLPTLELNTDTLGDNQNFNIILLSWSIFLSK